KQKSKQFKSFTLSEKQIENCNSFLTFDNLYTAPAHGFDNAHDYYEKNSAIMFLQNIKTPTLIINPKDDPFLTPECYPISIENQHIKLVMPNYGGHLGFSKNFKNQMPL